MKNRLASESSPYLRQHASNPVDWFPWGEEAFARAAADDKPVLLSIGYSSCHWCHVMERESFADPETAALLNAAFVCVKVDREERPDLDALYMAVCQRMTGSGGWPLTLLMTPERKPFFSATYLPKTARFGHPGLMDLVPRVRELWGSRRAELLEAADGILEGLRAGAPAPAGESPGRDLLERGYRSLGRSFDAEWGGFGGAPKFPMPHALRFLLRHHLLHPDTGALAMVRRTLDAMRAGGLRDHLGGGFHRYSTDGRWRVPHFEKMLYDQAQLALAYTEAWQATGDPAYRETARATLDYVLRDLADPAGGFHCAEDADSDGEEGKFYLWTREELVNALGEADGAAFSSLMNVEIGGNFETAAGGANGANVLYRLPGAGEEGAVTGLSPGAIDALLERGRRTLLQVRAGRTRPSKDDKVLTDWNGLAIAALARAGRAFGEPRYLAAAERAAAFIDSGLTTPDGMLLHRWRAGEAGIPGFLDDHAFLIDGLVELYAATWNARYLRKALELAERMGERFGDPQDGGYRVAVPGTGAPPTGPKELFDGALPSGNAAAMDALLRLAVLTGWSDLAVRAWEVARLIAPSAGLAPLGHGRFLLALDFGLGPSCEVVVVGRKGEPGTRALLEPLERGFHPHAVAVFKDADAPGAVEILAPFAAPMEMVGNKATAYVCVGNACGLPVTRPDEMMARIRAALGGAS